MRTATRFALAVGFLASAGGLGAAEPGGVRVHASAAYEVREWDTRIELLAAQAGFEGRLVILAEPAIATGDCRIEWADGGVVLDSAAIEAKISELVGRYLASRNEGNGP